MRKGSYSEELVKDVAERHRVQGDVISPLSHRADSRGGRHQSCSVPRTARRSEPLEACVDFHVSGNRQGRLRSSLGLFRLAAAKNTKDRIWSILLDHIRRVDHVELGCSVLATESQDRQLAARMQGQEVGNIQDTSIQDHPHITFLVVLRNLFHGCDESSSSSSSSSPPSPSVPMTASAAYFLTTSGGWIMSNSAVASLPVRVKIANSPPGCWERKCIENASVQDNPDFSFLGVLM